MKRKAFYLIFGISALASASCSDFLDQENTTNLNQESFFSSDEAIQSATAPLYNYVWNDFNSKFYYGMGDGRANNITAQYSDYIYPYTNFTESSLSEGLSDAWNALYSVVAQSNNTINNISNFSGAGVSEDAKVQGLAEARFMRGLAYWYIGSLWGGGIIYTNTNDLVNNYHVQPHAQADVFEFAIRDMEFAAKNLPAASSAAGRVNRYSAYGMLSRFYLTMAAFLDGDGEYDGVNVKEAVNKNRDRRNSYYLNLAKKAAEKVIAVAGNGKQFDLVDYSDLFANELARCNNNKECLFQLQWLTGSTDAIGWGCNQGITPFFGWSTMVADGTNWGGATYCSWDLWKEFSKENESIRRHCSIASIGEEYPEFGYQDDGSPYTYGKTENAGSQGANIRKYVVGLNKINGFSYKQSGGVNTYMMRLAEVYLNYTDAVLGNNPSTTDVEYFNLVRARAKMPAVSEVTYEALRHERRVEFAFEGLYWYDLLRRSYYNEDEIVSYINSQQRNASYGEPGDTYDGEKAGIYAIADSYAAPGPSVAAATARNLVLPVPDADQGKNDYLKPDANGHLITISYEFTEEKIKLFE